MDPQKFEALKVRVEGACGVNITCSFCDPRYLLQYDADVDASKSAHIVLFSLVPNVPNLPIFRGRWDDREKAVDVDLEGSWRVRSAFKRNLFGYSGHHTKQIVESPRRYAIDLRIPSAHVFQGEITLGTKIGVRLEGSLQVKAELTVSATIVRPNLLRRIVRWIRRKC